jgi:hypothetical protein
MDQDSTNGTSDKRNWRERLGIGTRDMPKISDEFKPQPGAESKTEQEQPVVRPAVKPHQPVSRTAPMAPRNPAPMAPRVAPAKQPAASNPAQAAARPAPPNEALADKLRAQRAAAERLAEQRVQAARERAESRMSDQPSARPKVAEPAQKPPSSARPKFSFADDANNADVPPPVTRTPAGPLVPPRPALGGDRGQPPFLRPSGPSAPTPSFRTETPPYRPIDPATGYPGASSRYQPTYRGNYGSEPGLGSATGRPPPPARRTPAHDPYARGPEPAFEPEPFADDTPRLGRPVASRGRGRTTYEEDQEDVFEDEQPRRRASARDYHSAYEQGEEGLEDGRRRSKGPWLLLSALLAAAVATAGVVWYYNTNIKTGSTASQGEVPVIAAPEEAAKTAPEAATDATGESPALKKKQIYDRIVGEQEMTGEQMVPTEEVPVQPEPATAATDEGGTSAIPAPAGAVPDALEEPAPLPLPPPESDQQGSLSQTGAEKLAAAASGDPLNLPVPGTTTGSTTPAAASTQQAAPPVIEEPAQTIMTEPEVAEEPPPKPKAETKTAAATTNKKATQQLENLGAEPVVLVPPSTEPLEALPDPGSTTSSAPPEAPAAAVEQPVKKKKTLLDLFAGNSNNAAPATAGEQVAALEQPGQATKATAPSGGSGFFVQLGTFRTQAEARKESQRLQSQHGDIVAGLGSSVVPATVAGSTRYGVRVGPVSSRAEATQVCSSLFAAGERDCLVRAQ